MSNDNWKIAGGIASLAISGLFYSIYNNRYSYYEMLRDIRCYHVGEELERDLEESNNHIEYAAVTGFVKQENDCFVGVKGDKGVIRTDKILQHNKEWNGRLRTWMKDVKEISSHTECKEFNITNRSADVSVSIQHPLEVNHSITDVLSQTHSEFNPVETPLLEKVVNILSSTIVTGYEKIELMLLCGSQVTVLGSVERTSCGMLIKPPESGNLKFVITKLSIGKAKENELFWLKFWKYATILFTGIGLAFISVIVYKRLKQYYDDYTFRQLRQDNDMSQGGNDCVVCMVNRRNVVLLPCGHISVCKACGDICNNCPICRTPKERLVPTFVS